MASNTLAKFSRIFGRKSSVVIGMIHVEALPGTPRNHLPMKDIIHMAQTDATHYKNAGVDAIMVENMHDIPYLNRQVGPEIVASMSVICSEVKHVANSLPCGVQILAGANKEALAVAKAASLDFIRAEGFVFSHIADEGTMNSDAGEILRYRKQIGADNVMVFTDIKKKHSSHFLTSDVSILEVAQAAEFFLSDGIILTGKTTGEATSLKEMQCVKESVNIPVLIGSGVDDGNMEQYLGAHAMIIGSHFKEDGHWSNPVSFDRVHSFMSKVERLRR
ncbi:uncharacterized protein F13E9.13, mitochondrial-like isoform X1 [Montipora foliosa]|uniref:uncharacterized protein F13E9.13, mitochondrial-like isoform X1 n=1 Tax=Montipora foliosa TaxID=591990 RepID=UPI0035F14261